MTDDEIRRTIASNRSWHAAARALGLQSVNGGAMRTLKKRAAELGVDTSHFTHQRTWSNEQLRQAIPRANTWSDVMRDLGVNDTAGTTRLTAKCHAVRLGIDITHLEPPEFDGSTDPGELQPLREGLRHAAEPFAVAWFAIRGLSTAAPTQPAAYDLLVTFPEGIRRVQVKTSTYRGKQGSWIVQIGQRPYVLDKTANRQPYDPDDLDYYFIIDGDHDLYLIPSKAVAGKKTICVGRYKTFRVGTASALYN
jgi:hypothetical protein